MRARVFVAVVSVFWVGWAGSSRAEDCLVRAAQEIPRSSEIKLIRDAGMPLVGFLDYVNPADSTLSLVEFKGATPTFYPLSEIREIHYTNNKDRTAFLVGGLLVGLAVGVVIASGHKDPPPSQPASDLGEAIGRAMADAYSEAGSDALTILGGGLAGLLLGAAAGEATHQHRVLRCCEPDSSAGSTQSR